MVYSKFCTLRKDDSEALVYRGNNQCIDAVWIGDRFRLEIVLHGPYSDDAYPLQTSLFAAVLMDENGNRIANSPARHGCFGQWVVEHDGDTYYAYVEQDLTVRRIDEIANIGRLWYGDQNDMRWHDALLDPPENGQVVLISGHYKTYRYMDSFYYCTDWVTYGWTPNEAKFWCPLPIPKDYDPGTKCGAAT